MKIVKTHPLVETRLIWMRDNQPNLLMQQWEACQVELSKNAGKTKARANLNIEVREPKAGYGGLFDGMQ